MPKTLQTVNKIPLSHSIGIMILIVFSLFSFQLLHAQTGYIYLHKKALDESSSVDFTFNITGDTILSGLLLNDKPDYFNVGDIGSSHAVTGANAGDGQLWATTVASPGIASYSQQGLIYLRTPGSSAWLPTGQTGYRIDGAEYNSMVYTNQAGNAYYYTYGGSANQIYNPANHGNTGLRDIAYGSGLTVVADNNGHILKYTGTYAAGSDSWSDLTAVSGIPPYVAQVDIQPSTQKIVLQEGLNIVVQQGTIYTMNNDGSGLTMIPYPASTGPATSYGLCVTDQGTIYATYYDNGLQADFIFDYDGSTWSINQQARYCGRPTGGTGNEVWAVNLNDEANTAATLFTLIPDGNRDWVDDERVRTNYTGNAIMIPVPAGNYTVTESLPAGWDLNGIKASDPTTNSSTNSIAKTATLNVSAGEIVHVTFTNELVQATTVANNCGIQVLEDFGSGGTTFTPPVVGITPYHYVADGFPLDGYYTIEKTGATWPITNSITADHTSDAIDGGNGYFMLVNASYGTDEFYRKRVVGLIPGESYTLSFFSANISPSLPVIPNITLGIANVNSGTFIDSISTGNITGSAWAQHIFTFSATTTTADMVIRNNGIGGRGNDLVIDDITLSQNCLLPFKLINFGALKQDNTVHLNWQTASETNTAYFVVEKSTDGINFQPIGKVLASGKSELNNYTFTDNNMTAVMSYYRLRITDKYKPVSLSPVRVVTQLRKGSSDILVYPNPARSQVQIILPGVAGEQSEVLLYNQGGQLVKTIAAGNQQAISLNTEAFAKGVYYIKLAKGNQVLFTTKMVKL
ncbi:MAG: T9SS type A sorting domain-containing protein [Bacteroidota bacterium]